MHYRITANRIAAATIFLAVPAAAGTAQAQYATRYANAEPAGNAGVSFASGSAQRTTHTGYYAPNNSPYRRHYAAPAQTYADVTPTHSSPSYGPTHAPSAPYGQPTSYDKIMRELVHLQDDGSFNHILQFAYVAGPGVLLQ